MKYKMIVVVLLSIVALFSKRTFAEAPLKGMLHSQECGDSVLTIYYSPTLAIRKDAAVEYFRSKRTGDSGGRVLTTTGLFPPIFALWENESIYIDQDIYVGIGFVLDNGEVKNHLTKPMKMKCYSPMDDLTSSTLTGKLNRLIDVSKKYQDKFTFPVYDEDFLYIHFVSGKEGHYMYLPGYAIRCYNINGGVDGIEFLSELDVEFAEAFMDVVNYALFDIPSLIDPDISKDSKELKIKYNKETLEKKDKSSEKSKTDKKNQ